MVQGNFIMDMVQGNIFPDVSVATSFLIYISLAPMYFTILDANKESHGFKAVPTNKELTRIRLVLMLWVP